MTMGLPASLATVQNVLILRTDHLGDLLLSTPLIRTMRTALPGRRFTLVASPANAGALDAWNAIDEVRVFDPAWPWRRKREFVRELRQTRWDLCLTLSPRTPSYLLGWLSGAPLRAGIIYSRRVMARFFSPWWLTHPVVLDVDELLAAGQSVPHEVKQLAKIAEKLGLPVSEPGPLEFPLDPDELVWAAVWLQENAAAFSVNRSENPSAHIPSIVGIHGAGKWLSQGWTAQDFLALVRSIVLMRPDTKVLLTFGPGDTALQTAVEAALAQKPCPAVLLPGQLPIARWAALLSLCTVVISPDTGSLHLAVALGCPVVAMYEAGTFLHCSAQWAPWQVPYGVVRRGIPAETLPLLVGEALRLIELEMKNA